MNYRKINNLVGWATFTIATSVYLATMEPTTSFWDCGEFISCAYKVEVGHSPGAPMFMLIQRLFAMMAGGNVENVAAFVNSWSAIASGLTILFLFWTITHFAKRLIANGEDNPGSNDTSLIMGSGLVGALSYTFSDTFWFSAVEAEVYATSSLFTALVFWAILKWEHIADQKYADRWLVLIAYIIGISVGIHLLNLLAIPALAMVYYFRKHTASVRGGIIAFVAGCVILGFVQFGVLQGIPTLASKFELLFVNSFGLPFDSGAWTFIVLLVAAMVLALRYFKKKAMYHAHVATLCLIFIIIGFSSYLTAIVRSRADVPVDMTNPDNALSLTSYIQREQFIQQPLLFGPDFTSQPNSTSEDGFQYARTEKDGKDHYEVVGTKLKYEYDPSDKRFFPRIWSGDGNHARFYRHYLGLADGERPATADNFKFFFGYQFNWMWWRYFMWNYAGRQNDIEGQTEAKNGNWMTGIKPFDKGVLGIGDIDKMSKGYRDNPARNQLYLLPFILGVLGLIYHFRRNKPDAIVTLVLFFFTGIAIAIYLNMSPLQPRERDYAFAGSTYGFAIWIGLGVLMVYDLLRKAVKGPAGIYVTVLLCLLAVPALMAKEEWNDHDRSKKTLARAIAWNTLNSCAPNAILFTYGDNDTYPLWYLQEVEGVRKDVRLINTSLLGIDWYIDQLNYRVNDADAVPMIWKKKDYLGDKGSYLRYYKSPQIPQDKFFNLVDILKFTTSDNNSDKMNFGGPGLENYYPTKNYFLPGLPTSELVSKGLLKAGDTTNLVNEVKFTFTKDIAYKPNLAMLNIIAAVAQEGWKRPIYFGDVISGDNFDGMGDYVQLEGIVFRLMPYRTNVPASAMQEIGSVNTDKSNDLFVNKYIWGNAQRNDVYFDSKSKLAFLAYRLSAGRTAAALTAQGRKQEAIALLDHVVKNISEESYYYDATTYYLAVGYYQAGAIEKGRQLAKKIAQNAEDDINYIMSLSDEKREDLEPDINQDLSIMNALRHSAKSAGDTVTEAELSKKITLYNNGQAMPGM
ncbi:DUF2723 domain-containing protein [Polluticoccus soli]|uniref:glycosyltransferase family 117 protein n=1 Tax=Polluticoccus soli TaxID=3034150 RepID=UPI0023E2738E|nr:DUF2723 domain-containing protein [Flavipsychrobacter sp. JY13-12]